MKGLSVVGELSDRSKDAIASVGERLSSLVVSFAFVRPVCQRNMLIRDASL